MRSKLLGYASAMAVVAACGSSGSAVGGACAKPADCVEGATCVAGKNGAVCAKKCATTPDCAGVDTCDSELVVGCCPGCTCTSALVCVNPCDSADADAGTCQCGSPGCMPGSSAWCNSGCGGV